MKERMKSNGVYLKELDDMIKINNTLREECMKKKKAIAYCRRRINRGLPVDRDRMIEDIEKEMRLNSSGSIDAMNVEAYMDEEQKTILEEERNDYERSLEMLQKTLDGILSSL